ncbi:MAG TPA: hypothetical protein VKD69_00150 [Vicinamibacterales bacterium]|nr:hypothetical protein [Vicinamibacterales bacterium]
MPHTETAAPPLWPEGKSFAFTVFDDPDAQGYDEGRMVYSFLADLGLRTTRGVWPGPAVRTPNSPGETCENAAYRGHSIALQAAGFEIGYHHTTKHSSTRDEIIRGLDAFRAYFSRDPQTMANHYNTEAIYWGSRRVTPPLRAVYTVATFGRKNGVHFGEVEGHPSFWGDVCRERIQYCRNFVFSDINTLAACPWMPYHDPLRPYVNAWYASTEGSNVERFTVAIAERHQERLEEQGGACIMYTHFGHGYVEGGRLHARFRTLMQRLSRKNGWFVPVNVLLDHLRQRREPLAITGRQRRSLEQRWLWEKMFRGTS